MEELLSKFVLLALIGAPFAAVGVEMLGRTEGLMLRTVGGVALIFALALVFGGFQERPNVARLVFVAFCGWPVCLLAAKGVRPPIPWRSLWISVSIMSWFLVNLMIALTDGGPLRGVVGLFFGWTYMLIPFGIAGACFLGIQRLLRKEAP